jgi:hypothetical protein
MEDVVVEIIGQDVGLYLEFFICMGAMRQDGHKFAKILIYMRRCNGPRWHGSKLVKYSGAKYFLPMITMYPCNRCKVDEATWISFLNRTPICGSQLAVQSLQYGGWVKHGDLPATLIIFRLVTFTKVKLHPPSSIMRSAIHQATTRLVFMPKVN